jgi:hypothetical protein
MPAALVIPTQTMSQSEHNKWRRAGLKAAATRKQNAEWLKWHNAGLKAHESRRDQEELAFTIADAVEELSDYGASVLAQEITERPSRVYIQ